MTRKHCIILLLVLGFVTRLPFLGTPGEVIFDEVHYGKFVDAYTTTGKYFFDVHPPWGKLVPAFLLKVSGYTGGQSFEKIGTPYSEANVWAIRIFACVLGSLTPLLIFLLLSLLGAGLPACLLGGCVFALDNGFILQSRLLMLYSPLIFFQIAALIFMLLAFERSYFGMLALCGLCAGLALGTQFTGLTASFVAGMIFLTLSRKKKYSLAHSLQGVGCFALAFLAIYLLGFYLHFHLLPLPGPGDAFYVLQGKFWADLVKLHEVMYSASATLTSSHPDMSPWYAWPMMTKPIFYWIGKNASIYLLGNPLVWTVGSYFLLYATFFWPSKRSRPFLFWVPFLLFGVAFFPLTLMKRVMFLYHYLIPILFGWIYLVLWMDTKRWIPKIWNEVDWKYGLILGFLVLGFIWIFPVTYGVSVSNFYWKTLPWLLFH